MTCIASRLNASRVFLQGSPSDRHRLFTIGRDRMRARGVWRIRPNRNSDAIGEWHQG